MITGKFAISYFDRNVIKKRWPFMNKEPLQKASNIVMRIARNSIRNQHKRHARPKLGWRDRLTRRASRPGSPPYSWQPGSTPPFKMIFSDWYGVSRRIVGMVWLGSNPPTPGLHEHGGWARRTVIVTRPRRTKGGKFTSPSVKWVPKVVHYPERPFMYPALIKARHRYAPLWRNSLSHGANLAA